MYWNMFRDTSLIAAAGMSIAGTVLAQEPNDPFRGPALEALDGKLVAYLPISTGFYRAKAGAVW
ncbi:MAG: hypothetical protein QNK95_11255 [Paracoccaceae bacterium]|jgi:hypothetical protein